MTTTRAHVVLTAAAVSGDTTHTVTEPELVEEIKRLAGDLSRRTTMWEHFHRVNSPENLQIMLELDEKARRSGRATGLPHPDLPPVATPEAVNTAEEAVRFPFPHLLRWRVAVKKGRFVMQKNRIELAGYLGAKPTVRYLPSGTPVANVRMAEGYRYTDRNNQAQEHTNWHSLVFYGELADIAALYEKGDNIFVEGTLQTRQFTPKDGSQRTVYEVVARSAHQITKTKSAKEAPADNDPQVQSSSVEPGIPAEVEGNVEVWPS